MTIEPTIASPRTPLRLTKAICRVILELRNFFLNDQPAEVASFFRVALGIAALLNEQMWSGYLREVFSNEGFFPHAFIRSVQFPLTYSLLNIFSPLAWTYFLYAFLVGATISFTLGKFTRISGAITYVLLVSFRARGMLVWNGPLNLLCICFFYCLFLPLDRAFVFNQSRLPNQRVPGWPIRLIQLQITLIYIFTSLYKFQLSPQWFSGTYLFSVLNSPTFSVFDCSGMMFYPVIAIAINWFSIAVEYTFPFWVWNSRMRRCALVLGFLLHAGIALMMNVDYFSETIMLLYAVFLKPNEISAAIRGIRRAGFGFRAWILREGGFAIFSRHRAFDFAGRSFVWLYLPLILLCAAPLKTLEPLQRYVSPVLNPLNLWQNWEMFSFAPQTYPGVRANLFYGDGSARSWSSPRVWDMGYWESLARGKYGKWSEIFARHDAYSYFLSLDLARYLAHSPEPSAHLSLNRVIVQQFDNLIPHAAAGTRDPATEEALKRNFYAESFDAVRDQIR